MLLLNPPAKWVNWPEARIKLKLSPISASVRRDIVNQTTTPKYNDEGEPVDLDRDSVLYSTLIGQACIKDWRGVCFDDGEPAACTADTIAQFMSIEPAEAFVIKWTRSIEAWQAKEIDKAKKD